MSVDTNNDPITQVPAKSSRDLTLNRRRYAYALIQRATSPAPRYGSAEWDALEDTDPRKIAAVVIAAESWAQDEDNLVSDLDAQISVGRQGLEDALEVDDPDAGYLRMFQARVILDALNEASSTYWETRADLLETALHRPGDYRGYATDEELRARNARISETVQAWRDHAAQLRTAEGVA